MLCVLCTCTLRTRRRRRRTLDVYVQWVLYDRITFGVFPRRMLINRNDTELLQSVTFRISSASDWSEVTIVAFDWSDVCHMPSELSDVTGEVLSNSSDVIRRARDWSDDVLV